MTLQYCQERPWPARAILFVFALLAFGPAIKAPFLFDDHVFLEGNPSFGHWSFESAARDFRPGPENPWYPSYFRPIQTLSHRLDIALFGLNPIEPHVVNWLLHFTNSCLVMELGVLVGLGGAACLLAGVLFAIHPIIVSELLMVSGRAEILSLTFALLAIRAFFGKSRATVLAGGALFLAALLSKESALSVPLFSGIIAWKRKRWENWRAPAMSMLAAILIYGALRVSAGIHAEAIGSRGEMLVRGLGAVPLALVRSFFLVLFPYPLYNYRIAPEPHPIAGFALVGAISVALWYTRSRNRWITFGILWFLAAWAPKIPLLVSGRYLIDFWAYPALPGLLWPLAAGLTRKWDFRFASTVQRACTLFLLLGWTFSSRLHIALRNTDEKSYRWSLRFTRSVPLYANWGLLCLRAGRVDEALAYLKPALDAYPEDPKIQALYQAALKAAWQQRAR